MTPPQRYPAQPAAPAPPARVRTGAWLLFLVSVWLVVLAAAPMVLAKAAGTWIGWREQAHLAAQRSDPSRSLRSEVFDPLPGYHAFLPLVSIVEFLAWLALPCLALVAFALAAAVGEPTPRSPTRLALLVGDLAALAAAPWLLMLLRGDNPPPTDVRTDVLTLVILTLLAVAVPVLASRLIGPLAFQAAQIQTRPSAGWYDDPMASGSTRWWDRTEWTDFTG